MQKFITVLVLLFCSAAALADKYGIDEAMDESEGSWGAIILVILVLGYLYYKEKN